MEANPMITRYAMSWAIDENQYVYVNPMESPKGNWVKYEDYARLLCDSVHDLNQIGGLQQELARLRASSFVTAVPVEEYEKLKSEVKRLKNNCDYLDQKLDEELNKSAMLGEQVERLTDAITRGACIPDAKAE